MTSVIYAVIVIASAVAGYYGLPWTGLPVVCSLTTSQPSDSASSSNLLDDTTP